MVIVGIYWEMLVLDGMRWYSMIFNGIHWYFKVFNGIGRDSLGFVGIRLYLIVCDGI